MGTKKTLKSRIKGVMPNWVKKTYGKIRQNAIKEKIKDDQAKKWLKKVSKKATPGKIIKVGFLVQMSEVWDKQELLYEALSKNKDFETYMIVVPNCDLIKNVVKNHYDDMFFFNKYDNAIKALQEDGRWLDLKKLELDYLFYQRPYNAYLPECYKSYVVGRYTKCMYIPYAFWPLKESLCGYNKDFYRYVYKAFMESQEHAKAIQDIHIMPSNIVYCGYPQLTDAKIAEDYDIRKVLWTPRWSYDPKVGGSHFLEYKDHIFELTADFGATEVIIRPHPMSFDNYIRMGLMTEEQVAAYKQRVEDTSNVCFDDNKNIEDTFENIGVLITDVSSIVFPFFLTGKPIIFCNTEIPLSPAFEALLKGIYVADSWEDICTIYSQIVSGNDYLKDVRMEMVDTISKEHNGAVNNIIDILKKDALFS